MAAILLAFLAGCGSAGRAEKSGGVGPSAAPATGPKPATTQKPCDYPTRPGTYKSGEWEYTYTIQLEGTRSESRIGKLKRDGKEVAGKLGQVLDTPLGRFLYFGKGGGWRSGWLNTDTYDGAVFNKEGRLRPAYVRMLFLPDEQKLQAMWKAAGGGGSYPRENVLAAPGGRVYVWGGAVLHAFDAKHKPAWKHAARWLIIQVKANGRGDVLVSDQPKGGIGALSCFSAKGELRWKKQVRTGYLFVTGRDRVVFAEHQQAQGVALTCLAPDGSISWRKELPVSLVGVDASDRILARCGEGGAEHLRLFSRDGRVLWEKKAEPPAPALPKDRAGNYLIPGGPTARSRS